MPAIEGLTNLACDLQKARYVAVKVITADASDCTQEASRICSLGNQPSKPGRGGILIQLPEVIDRLSTLELYERFGKPEPEDIVRLDGKPLSNSVPAQVFIPGWFGVCSEVHPQRFWRIF
ncbi:hypothetical protein N7453_007063 [Penicillium expansum]|nr:hypothetical protein N7453_007063 [Penicillium expansum]